MSMYKEVSTNLNFVEREKETEKFWEEHHVFEESVEERKDDPSYTFYEVRPQQMASRISAIWKPGRSKTCFPATRP